ncbi:SixA phosphatase family protein [Shewanella sp. GXUN23E]|uniref:SixA phosphatase family protein n=1 Tax=Shewanella sp. GXUN23E TaxID=3422498 RepID=UPI003D7D39F3
MAGSLLSLTLVRHAKSSWNNPLLADVLRPLNARGERDVPKMAAHFALLCRTGTPPGPDVWLSSPAIRAHATACGFIHACGLPEGQLGLNDSLYHASLDQLIDLIRQQSDDCHHLCLFGHNPGFNELADWLDGGGFSANIPTCALVQFTLNVTAWSQLTKGGGRLLRFDGPKWLVSPR